MSILKNEDYMYLFSQLTNDKIPQHIKEKIDKDLDFTTEEEREILHIIRNDQDLKKIKYKGIPNCIWWNDQDLKKRQTDKQSK